MPGWKWYSSEGAMEKMLGKINPVLMSVMLFLFVFSVYFSKAVYWPYDSRWSLYTAMSMIYEHNTDLDEYLSYFDGSGKWELETHSGHFYSPYPLGASIMAMPFLLTADLVFRRLLAAGGTTGGTDKFEFDKYFRGKYPTGLEFGIACFYMSMTVVLMYWLIRMFLNVPRSLLLSIVFAFGTAAWPTASRALWQHGPSMLMLVLTLFLLLKAKTKPALVQYTGLTLACSYVIRPTNSLSVILLTIYVFWEYRQYFLRFMFWAAMVAVPFLWHNWNVYHSLFSPYYRSQFGFSWPALWEGLAGNMISPARGLLVFSPIFVFSAIGVIIKTRSGRSGKLDWFIISIIFLHWAVISIWPCWWGADSFGYRLFSDMVPYLIYLMIPFFSNEKAGAGKTILWSAFGILLVASVIINGNGAMREHGRYWNFVPDNISQNTKRLWDWKKPQFLSGITFDSIMK